MLEIKITIEGCDTPSNEITNEFLPEQKVVEVAQFIANKLDSSVEDVLDNLIENGEKLEKDAAICSCAKHVHRWHLKLTCIELHFETESATHRFSPQTKWAQVHEWAAKHFQIASDVSANLELRLNTQTGSRLNDKAAIGHFECCQIIWLVKPGPENNG